MVRRPPRVDGPRRNISCCCIRQARQLIAVTFSIASRRLLTAAWPAAGSSKLVASLWRYGRQYAALARSSDAANYLILAKSRADKPR